MRRAVEPFPGGGVGEPEVRPAVDDQRVVAELVGQRRRVAVRQPQEHHIVSGQHLGIGGFQHAIAQREQVRVVFGERRARAGGGGQRADGQPTVGVGGMAEQQPQDFPPA